MNLYDKFIDYGRELQIELYTLDRRVLEPARDGVHPVYSHRLYRGTPHATSEPLRACSYWHGLVLGTIPPINIVQNKPIVPGEFFLQWFQVETNGP